MVLNNIMRLALFLFLSESLVMLAMDFFNIAEEHLWQRALWDTTAVALIIVPALSYRLRRTGLVSRSQTSIFATKSAAIIFSSECAIMLLFDMIVPFGMAGWQEALADGLLFAAIGSPSIYHWTIKPLADEGYSSDASISVHSSMALAALVGLSALLFDISLPFGVAAGIPYIALVLIGLWFPQRYAAVVLASTATFLTFAGYYISEPMAASWVVLSNRGLALFAIWITAMLVTSQRHETEKLRLLYAAAENANAIQSADKTFQTSLNDICAYTGWPIGHLYLLAPDAQGVLLPANAWSFKEGESFTPFVTATMNTSFDKGAGLPGEVLARGKSIWIEDVTKHPNFPRAQMAAEAGVRAACAVPIFAGEDIIAVMEFFSGKTAKPDIDLLHLLENIGGLLGRVFERQRAAEQLSHMASHDSLTGLPNLSLGQDRLSGAIAMARRNGTKATLMFIDLDGFKLVNDTLGHSAGDQLLREISSRFSSCVREVDTVARIGGDEFIIILTSSEGREGAERVAQKVIAAVNEPFRLQEHHASVGVSIGIAIYPDHGEDSETLLTRADDAMYLVKAKGKNDYAFAQ
ncbi:MAG: sensor domain-containing diguanylate cyclase [Mariprofundaceae bacterium]|nr:sensor domain-containing diguanylate cyclase [Mariprofundaceae bacterium]